MNDNITVHDHYFFTKNILNCLQHRFRITTTGSLDSFFSDFWVLTTKLAPLHDWFKLASFKLPYPSTPLRRHCTRKRFVSEMPNSNSHHLPIHQLPNTTSSDQVSSNRMIIISYTQAMKQATHLVSTNLVNIWSNLKIFIHFMKELGASWGTRTHSSCLHTTSPDATEAGPLPLRRDPDISS